MTLPPLLPRLAPLALALALASAPLAAQEFVPSTDTSPAACAAITTDAARLACYDRLFAHTPQATAAADAAAEAAAQARREERQTARVSQGEEKLRERVSDLFRPAAPDSALANAGRGSLLDSRWELAEDSKLGPFQLRAYKPVYLLPAFWTSDRNTTPHSPNPANTVTTPQVLDSAELKFQISFKTKIAENLFGDNGDIWAGYTQSSRWQAYNGEDSRPFRETNYEPEIMMVFRNGYSIGGWRGRMSGLSLTHMSNGRADPLSRSWNRVMLNVGLDREGWAIVARPWWRISDGNADENPGIEDYVGRGDVTIVHQVGGNDFALMARHSLRGGDRSRGALQFDWGFPISRTLRGHLQMFDGYGESLIDYNHRAAYVGLGVSLLEWY
jgi:phospholipase A1